MLECVLYTVFCKYIYINVHLLLFFYIHPIYADIHYTLMHHYKQRVYTHS